MLFASVQNHKIDSFLKDLNQIPTSAIQRIIPPYPLATAHFGPKSQQMDVSRKSSTDKLCFGVTIVVDGTKPQTMFWCHHCGRWNKTHTTKQHIQIHQN